MLLLVEAAVDRLEGLCTFTFARSRSLSSTRGVDVVGVEDQQVGTLRVLLL